MIRNDGNNKIKLINLSNTTLLKDRLKNLKSSDIFAENNSLKKKNSDLKTWDINGNIKKIEAKDSKQGQKLDLRSQLNPARLKTEIKPNVINNNK